MACFYMIYRYVFSEWRSIRLVEINQFDITMATHYDIIMDNYIAMDAHCEIRISKDVAREIHFDIRKSNKIALCTYHGITMHNDISINFFLLCILYSMPIVLFCYGLYGINTRTRSWLISLDWRTHLLFLCRAISYISTQTQLTCSSQIYQTISMTS